MATAQQKRVNLCGLTILCFAILVKQVQSAVVCEDDQYQCCDVQNRCICCNSSDECVRNVRRDTLSCKPCSDGRLACCNSQGQRCTCCPQGYDCKENVCKNDNGCSPRETDCCLLGFIDCICCKRGQECKQKLLEVTCEALP